MLTKKCNKVWKSSDRVFVAVKDGRCYIVNGYVGVTFPAVDHWWNEYARPGLLCDMPEEGEGFQIENGCKTPNTELTAFSLWDSTANRGTGNAHYTPFSFDIQSGKRGKTMACRVFEAEGKPVIVNPEYVAMVDISGCAQILHPVGRGSFSPLTFWSDGDHTEGVLILPIRIRGHFESALAAFAHA